MRALCAKRTRLALGLSSSEGAARLAVTLAAGASALVLAPLVTNRCWAGAPPVPASIEESSDAPAGRGKSQDPEFGARPCPTPVSRPRGADALTSLSLSTTGSTAGGPAACGQPWAGAPTSTAAMGRHPRASADTRTGREAEANETSKAPARTASANALGRRGSHPEHGKESSLAKLPLRTPHAMQTHCLVTLC